MLMVVKFREIGWACRGMLCHDIALARPGRS